MQIVMDTPRSFDAWQGTMQKMVNLGAKGTDQQYDDIMDYLHRTMTTIDVNSAGPDELEIVLNASEATAQAIVARRETKKFTGLADLKSIPGIDAATVDSKAAADILQLTRFILSRERSFTHVNRHPACSKRFSNQRKSPP